MPKSASLLSAEWINQRIENVIERVDKLLDRILEEGLLSSGYLPLEKPLTKELLMKMTPQQVLALLDSYQTPEERIEVLRTMGLPLDEIYDMIGVETKTPKRES